LSQEVLSRVHEERGAFQRDWMGVGNFAQRAMAPTRRNGAVTYSPGVTPERRTTHSKMASSSAWNTPREDIFSMASRAKKA
jgi:hypothetical protein